MIKIEIGQNLIGKEGGLYILQSYYIFSHVAPLVM
jgi:hypothetical protein